MRGLWGEENEGQGSEGLEREGCSGMAGVEVPRFAICHYFTGHKFMQFSHIRGVQVCLPSFAAV